MHWIKNRTSRDVGFISEPEAHTGFKITNGYFINFAGFSITS